MKSSKKTFRLNSALKIGKTKTDNENDLRRQKNRPFHVWSKEKTF